MDISDRLRDLRNRLGHSQTDMANFLKISRQAYNNYERAIREPDIETVAKLAEIFNVTTDYLLGKTDDPTPSTARLQDPCTSAGKDTIRISPYGCVKKTVQIPLEKLHAIEAMLKALEE